MLSWEEVVNSAKILYIAVLYIVSGLSNLSKAGMLLDFQIFQVECDIFENKELLYCLESLSLELVML